MDIHDLQKMQAWPLQDKVFHTITSIQSFMNRVDEMRNRHCNNIKQQSKGFYISFSGGKDSTVLLDIARRFIDPEFPAVFCNTGTEYPEILQFVKSYNDVQIIHPKTSFKQVLEKYGFPLVSKYVSHGINRVKYTKSEKEYLLYMGKDKNYSIPQKYRFLINMPFDCSDKCCECLKKNPFKEYELLYHRFPILGVTCQESNQRKLQWVKEGGCNYYSNHRSISKPMSIWLESDVWNYISRVGLKISPIYDKLPEGQKRTGCMVCGFSINGLEDRLKLIKSRYPKLYDFYMNIKNHGTTFQKALNSIIYLY